MRKMAIFKSAMALLILIVTLGGYSGTVTAQSLRSSTANQNSEAFVAVTTWRSGRWETTYNRPASVTCNAPAGTVFAYRTLVTSGYGGRDGHDAYFWMCFYKKAS